MNMNWKIILASIFLILGLATILITAFLMLDTPPKQSIEESPQVLFPTSGVFEGMDSTGRLTLTGESGEPIAVKDFIRNGETVTDTVNPGSFVLAGSVGYCLEDGSCPEGANTDNFSITYNNEIQSFNIVLLAEPLRRSREASERFLIERLGLSKEDLCRLNYNLGVPYFVNEQFAGQNLRFSFCKDAIVLP